jgi:hypothetical protein
MEVKLQGDRAVRVNSTCAWLVSIAVIFIGSSTTFADDMPSQTAAAVLTQQFSSATLSYLLLDVPSGSILAERWPDAAQPFPIGSLIKPFTAIAWADTHRPFPEVVCRGTRDACWLPQGHGRMTVENAITQSCNAYFLALGRDISRTEANATLRSYELPPINSGDKAFVLAGLSANWKVTPRALAAAYLKLESDAARTRFDPLLEGMRRSASAGTARAIAVALPATPVLAKTGTAPCSHTPRATADGLTAVFFPAEQPRLFLLVRVHGVTGAVSAAIAGRMLRALEVGEK